MDGSRGPCKAPRAGDGPASCSYRWCPRMNAAFWLLLTLFMALGAAAGAWQAVLADLARALALSPGPLGLALMSGGVASIPVMFLGGKLVDRRGVRVAIVGGAALIALAFAAHVGAQGFWGLVGGLLLYGCGGGLYDVGINAAAARWEASTGRKGMAWLHAGFSGGAVLGALGAGAMLGADLPFRGVYETVCVAMAAIAVATCFARRLGEAPQASEAAASAAAAAAGRSLYRPGPVLVLALMALSGYYGESAMEAWSAIYLRENLGVTALVGASGVAVFHVAMTTGRLGAGVALQYVGRRAWLGVAGLIGALGTAIAVGTATPAIAIGGFLLVGFGLSGVAPMAFSLAGEVAPRRVGEATAVITTIGYAGALIAPGVIGAIAEGAGLQVALATVALGALGIAGLALRLRAEDAPAPAEEAA